MKWLHFNFFQGISNTTNLWANTHSAKIHGAVIKAKTSFCIIDICLHNKKIEVSPSRDGDLRRRVGDCVDESVFLTFSVKLERVFVEVEAAQGLDDARLVVDLNAELLVAKVEILELLPLKDSNWKRQKFNE